jgi:3-phenylpropionate/trans-cinnamate dioxygenase ferredoxin reductase subunit
MQAGVVIVGSGQGGFQVAASLRDEGYAGAITLIGDEPGLPYQRPPLSKAYLAGEAQPRHVELRPVAFYAERGIDVIAPERVVGIARAARRVTLASGKTLPYEHLVLATGARARMPVIAGAELTGIVALRTRADADGLLAFLQQARRVVIVGAGFIGLEVAVVARQMGLDVRILELADRVLKRAVSAESAAFLAQAQIERGVQISLLTGAAAYSGSDGRVTGVLTTQGETVPADLVVVGIGVDPNVDLARDAGLAVQDGIVVDQCLLTADSAISAIGDCARFPAAYADCALRLESVQNSVDQARCVAARLSGKPQVYVKVPWFWSDQGPNRLQIAGVASVDDSVVLRGDPAMGKFSVFRFRAGRLSAVESINSAGDHMAARKLLAMQTPISPDQAADCGLKLTALAVAP